MSFNACARMERSLQNRGSNEQKQCSFPRMVPHRAGWRR